MPWLMYVFYIEKGVIEELQCGNQEHNTEKTICRVADGILKYIGLLLGEN